MLRAAVWGLFKREKNFRVSILNFGNLLLDRIDLLAEKFDILLSRRLKIQPARDGRFLARRRPIWNWHISYERLSRFRCAFDDGDIVPRSRQVCRWVVR